VQTDARSQTSGGTLNEFVEPWRNDVMNKPSVVQFEITGEDAAVLHSFYAGLFGWDLLATPGGTTSSYRRTTAAETGVPGAIGPTRSGPNVDRPSDWDGGSGQVTIYVEVENLGESMVAAERLGGTIVTPLHEYPGRDLKVAFIADPEGHIVGLSQGLQRALEQTGYATSEQG
jgi:predicted enzyme related to lactoylglutathione lyase